MWGQGKSPQPSLPGDFVRGHFEGQEENKYFSLSQHLDTLAVNHLFWNHYLKPHGLTAVDGLDATPPEGLLW